MNNTDDRIRNIQIELLKLLKEFDAFCRENDIRYTLHAGTLIGAVREGGFIPWDDDVDLGMTRSQYKKLKSRLLSNPSGNLLLDHTRDKIKKIWFRDQNEDAPKVWLDIFIYDYVSGNPLAQKLRFAGIKVLTAFSKSETEMKAFRANKKAKGLSLLVYEMLYSLGRHFPLEKRLKLFDNFSEYFLNGSKKYLHRSNDRLWAMPMVVPVRALRKYKYVPFEDTSLMITKDYDLILSQAYGPDYMTPKKVSDKRRKIHEMTRDNFDANEMR